MTIASRMVTRRALLGAGVLLVAGCGPPEAAEVDEAEVWSDSLRAAQIAEAAYGNDDGRTAARRRVATLEAEVVRTGGTPPIAPTNAASGGNLALVAERAALRTYIAAVGRLKDAHSREVLADVITGSGAAESEILLALAKDPAQSSFPGQPL